MKLATLIACCLLALNLSGQTFPLKSSEWYISNQGGNKPPDHKLEIIKYLKDTVIHDTICAQLSNGYCFYYQNDSVYFFNPHQNQFGLMYDFTAKAGDQRTFILPVKEYLGKTHWTVRIDSVKIESIGFDTIRKFYTSELSGLNINFDPGYYATRYGADMFFPMGPGFERDYLKCYVDSIVSINMSKTKIPCDSSAPFGGIKELESRFTIHPNPASDYLNVTSDLTIEQIVIWDLHSRTVLNVSPDAHSFSIAPLRLTPGLYLVGIKTSDNRTATKRIVVQ